MSESERRQALADFLRTRRARLSPADVNLLAGKRRRAPGLRREEVAQLANVGVSWYTSLEQARDIRPSREILQSIANALQLTTAERQHLFLLADQAQVVPPPPPDEYISPTLQRVMNALDPNPAYIMGSRWDYLAWNNAAGCVFSPTKIFPPHTRNIIWRIFTDPMKRLHNWEELAQSVLAEFRAETAHFADEAWFKQLVADLQDASPEFRAWWPHHDVGIRRESRKNIEHPDAGTLSFEHTTLQVPSDPGLKVMIYIPLTTTDTTAKIQRLMQVAAKEMVQVRQ